jgi:thiol:disulfide interchange protein
MKWITYALCANLLLAGAAYAGADNAGVPTPPSVVKQGFDEHRNATDDISRAVAFAKANNRRIILDVGGDWCSWCMRLDKLIASNADTVNLIDSNYVWVKVNYSPENKNEQTLSRYPKVLGYPHLFVLDADGKVLQSQDTSEFEEGKGYNSDRFTDFLKRWAPKSQ